MRSHPTTDVDPTDFEARFGAEFARRRTLVHRIYGDQASEQLALLADDCAASWQSRPAELRSLDARRAERPGYYRSNGMLGGACSRGAHPRRSAHRRLPHLGHDGLPEQHPLAGLDARDDQAIGRILLAHSIVLRTRGNMRVLANFSDGPAQVSAQTPSGMPDCASDRLTGNGVMLTSSGTTRGAHQCLW